MKGHLYKLELVDNPTCDGCLYYSETILHMPCYCEALAELRYC